jgi:hypothetical protein
LLLLRKKASDLVFQTQIEKATTTASLRIKALKQVFWFPPKRMPPFQEVREHGDV